MNSGVNKCITMRLLKNILHYILIININKALKLTLSNKPILLNTMNASHLRNYDQIYTCELLNHTVY